MHELELARRMAAYRGKGYVIAPAGYGKTHLIAMAVKEGTRRQLILTHTFAGVRALKKKLFEIDASGAKFQVDTIASWALRLSLAYPKTTDWIIERPTNNEWGQLYKRCSQLLAYDFSKEIIQSTYSGIYVDEYQDCTVSQHELISALCEILPCRILGDPMQAIFDFADPLVDWDTHIYNDFTSLGELTTPWRWRKAGREYLGEWLNDVREQLENGRQFDLTAPIPKGVERKNVDFSDYRDDKWRQIFYKFLRNDDRVIGIHKGTGQYKSKTHALARSLKGSFSSIEEVEGKSLFNFVYKVTKASTSSKKLRCSVEFAKKCMTGVGVSLPDKTVRGDRARIVKRTRHPQLVLAANDYYDNPTSKNLKSFLVMLKDINDTHVYRHDLLNRILQVLEIHAHSPTGTLEEAANLFQKKFRYQGRYIGRSKLIGTTLLVKGLEFDHAIVLEAESLSTKELYVALTRGSKSITINSSQDRLPVA